MSKQNSTTPSIPEKVPHPSPAGSAWMEALAEERHVPAAVIGVRAKAITALIEGLLFDLQTDALVTQTAAQVERYIRQQSAPKQTV